MVGKGNKVRSTEACANGLIDRRICGRARRYWRWFGKESDRVSRTE